jgi:hypothetical protein
MKKQEDYLVASLLDFFRDSENEEKWAHAAKIALNQIERMAQVSSSNLNKRFLYFATHLKNNISPSTVRAFAQACFDYACKSQVLKSHTMQAKPLESRINPAFLRRKAKEDLKRSFALGHSEPVALMRAAQSLRSEEINNKDALKRAQKISNHPLASALEILNTSHAKVAKEDIRNKLLNLKRFTNKFNSHEGKLFNILKKAQSFSLSHLHALLGDELFYRCRPLGFLDKNDLTIVIEVPSSAHLHELSYRKQDILRALKQDDHFRKARFIKFIIKNI